MTITTPRRLSALVAIGAATALGAATLTGVPVAAAATASVTILDPGTPTAGAVTLRGTASGGTLTTTVLFSVDVSQSTAHPSELDCDGNSNFGPKDNFNGDDTTGDVLDCEISAVNALNSGLAASAGSSLVSLQHFSTTAAADDLDPAPGPAVLFDSPSNNGTGSEPRIVTAARTLRRSTGPTGTTFEAAINLALQTLGSAPAGPKWIMFLSDGRGTVANTPAATTAILNKLKASGVHLRAFAIDDKDNVGCGDGLGDMARITGESCVSVPDPAKLASAVSTTQPDGVTAVRVTLGGQTLAATLDIAGGWSLPLTLGAGTYPTHVVATLSSGKTVSADRTFTVAPGAPGSTPPPPGSVVGPPSAVIAAASVRADRPKPLLQRLPGSVTGPVGRASATGPVADPAFEGATVLLQGRGKAGTAWRNVGTAKVAQARYSVSWTRTAKVKKLRVLLLPYKNFTTALAAVPRAGISDCHRSGSSSAWTMTCRTTAANGKHAKLLKRGKVVDRANVRRHHVSVSGSGRLSAYKLVVKAAPGQAFRLRL